MHLTVKDCVSSKGKPYSVLEIHFDNGYVFNTFLNNEQKFCIESALANNNKKGE